MSLSIEQVRHVARLASLALGEEEVESTLRELNDILSHIEQLSTVNTAGVVPTSHAHGIVNNFREDVIKDSLPVETALKNAKDTSASGFRVPRII